MIPPRCVRCATYSGSCRRFQHSTFFLMPLGRVQKTVLGAPDKALLGKSSNLSTEQELYNVQEQFHAPTGNSIDGTGVVQYTKPPQSPALARPSVPPERTAYRAGPLGKTEFGCSSQICAGGRRSFDHP